MGVSSPFSTNWVGSELGFLLPLSSNWVGKWVGVYSPHSLSGGLFSHSLLIEWEVSQGYLPKSLSELRKLSHSHWLELGSECHFLSHTLCEVYCPTSGVLGWFLVVVLFILTWGGSLGICSSTFHPQLGRVARDLSLLHAIWHGMEAQVYSDYPGELQLPHACL